jgi:hypothetical protein
MSAESLGSDAELLDARAEVIEFDEYGSLPDDYLMARFGMTSEEGRQEVAFGKYSGTWAQMLADDRCPVGGMAAAAHREGGTTAVREKLTAMGSLFNADLSVKIADKTKEDYERAGVTVHEVDVNGVITREFTVPKKKLLRIT